MIVRCGFFFIFLEIQKARVLPEDLTAERFEQINYNSKSSNRPE